LIVEKRSERLRNVQFVRRVHFRLFDAVISNNFHRYDGMVSFSSSFLQSRNRASWSRIAGTRNEESAMAYSILIEKGFVCFRLQPSYSRLLITCYRNSQILRCMRSWSRFRQRTTNKRPCILETLDAFSESCQWLRSTAKRAWRAAALR
jgi:hypothetical protein